MKKYGQIGRVDQYSYFRLKYKNLALAEKVFTFAKAYTPQITWNKYYDVTMGHYKVELEGYIATEYFNQMVKLAKNTPKVKVKQLKLSM